jgi:hypothetical protein
MSSWVYVLTDSPAARSMVDVMIRENKVKYSAELAPKVCGHDAGWQGKDSAGIPTREIDCLIDNSIVVLRLQGDPIWLSAQSPDSLLFTMVDRQQYTTVQRSTPVEQVNPTPT